MTNFRHYPGDEAAILEEVPHVTGLVLWQNWRYLRDWIGARPDVRTRLFHDVFAPWVLNKRADARAETPTLAPTLLIWDEWLRAPGAIDDTRLADACELTALWAQERGYMKTALLFAETAAQLQPQDPRRAILAGRLARSGGQMGRAERWFNLSISLARKQAQWEEYIRGHLGLGILFMLTKKDARARTHFSAASTKANRHGYEWLAGEAQHDLFQFMTVRGQYDAAETHARTALNRYPKNNPRVPFLAADVAFLLICRKHYSHAVELLRGFLRIIKTPPDNLLGLSMFVRALAGAGESRKFERMRRRLLRVDLAATPFEAAALWHLAEAERAMQQWEAAAQHARAALERASVQHDLETAEFARETLRKIDARTPTEPEAARSEPDVDAFVVQLASRLAEWAPTRRGRPRRRTPEDWSR